MTQPLPTRAPLDAPARSAVVVGAGGVIASYLLPHLVRMDLDRLTLVDGDSYEQHNLRSQDIVAADVGRVKVAAQADRLRRIDPRCSIEPIAERVEDLPLGWLRADLLVSCVDARSPRQYLNQVAWWLNMPLVDLAVEATGRLVRCDVYVPGPEGPCLECPWDLADYDALELEYPCLVAGGARGPATNAPAALGAAAAALGAIEIEKAVQGRFTELLAGQSVMLDLRYHRSFVTSYRRRSSCRFDHRRLQLESFVADERRATLDRLVEAAGSAASEDAAIGVAGQEFVTRLFCGPCSAPGPDVYCLERQLSGAMRPCPRCGEPMVARGLDKRARLTLGRIPAERRRAPLEQFGLRAGDVVSVSGAGDTAPRHLVWELKTSAAAGRGEVAG